MKIKTVIIVFLHIWLKLLRGRGPHVGKHRTRCLKIYGPFPFVSLFHFFNFTFSLVRWSKRLRRQKRGLLLRNCSLPLLLVSGNSFHLQTQTENVMKPSFMTALTEGRGSSNCEVGVAAIDLNTAAIVLCQISDSHSYVNTLTKINIFDPIEVHYTPTNPGTGRSINRSKCCRYLFRTRW